MMFENILLSLHYFVFPKLIAKRQESDACLAILCQQYTQYERLTFAFLASGLITEFQIRDERYFY